MKVGNIKIRLARKFPEIFYRFYSTTTDQKEVNVQSRAYRLFCEKYLNGGERVLDAGAGLGFGISIMSEKTKELTGIDVDKKSIVFLKQKFIAEKGFNFLKYNGKKIPFRDNYFDYAVSVDVIEHVKEYRTFIKELLRVSKKGVFISTPIRRSENTRENGKPINIWHLREWSFDEFNFILNEMGLKIRWYFINGEYEGPFSISDKPEANSQTLTPFIFK